MTSAMKGDTVKCLVDNYHEYSRGQHAYVLEVGTVENTGARIIKLANRKSPIGYAWYSACNFEFVSRAKEKTMAAYERTKYFGIRVDANKQSGHFLYLDEEHMTKLEDTKSQAFTDVKSVIQEGEQWVVLQTVAMITGEAPRPPISIVEYK